MASSGWGKAAPGVRWAWVVPALLCMAGARAQTAAPMPGMTADSLAVLLQQAPAGGGAVVIANQEIDGAVRFNDDTGTIEAPANVRFEQCHFTQRVQLSGCHFHGSLTLARCTFDKGLDLSDSTVDGDLILRAPAIPSPPEKARALLLSGARVGGELLIGRPRIEGAINAASVTAWRLSVNLDGAQVNDLNFAGLTADSAFFFAAAQGRLEAPLLALGNASLKNVLSLRNLRLQNLRMISANVGYLTQFDNVRVANELDLSETSLHSFHWTVAAAAAPGPAWPKRILLDGTTFQDGLVELPAGAKRPDDAEQIPGIGDTLLCLQKAEYSQSAFESLEAELTRRGEIPQADDVFFAMHHANRAEQWTWNPATWPWGFFDSFQDYVLSYGRTATTPLLWSAFFVVLGTFIFRRRAQMIAVEDSGKPPEFSASWYSLELFLPVVDLGMAKSWRPASRLLQTYARVHQVAGWVLIPVALAAITGVGR